MTSINVIKEDGKVIAFTCNGHAEYADYSQDIVCAAISILVMTTINSLECLLRTKMCVEADDESGYIHCSIEQDPTESTELLLQSMILGLSQIQKEYGSKYIDVKIKEV